MLQGRSEIEVCLIRLFQIELSEAVFGIGAGATTKLVKNSKGKEEILRIFSPKYPYEYLQETKDIARDVADFFKRS